MVECDVWVKCGCECGDDVCGVMGLMCDDVCGCV